MLSKQTNKRNNNNRLAYKKRLPKDNRRHAPTATTTRLSHTCVPARLRTGLAGQHSRLCYFFLFRAWRRHRYNHKSEGNCPASTATFFVLPPFVCARCCVVLETTTAKLKRTTGIQITLSRRNQQKAKAKGLAAVCRCGPRAPRTQAHTISRSYRLCRQPKAHHQQQQR